MRKPCPPGKEIEFVSFDDRIAITEDGTICKITSMYDIDGDETEDPEAAASAVVMVAKDHFVAIDRRSFKKASMH